MDNTSATPMVFDDGTQAWVPNESVQDAVKDGGRLVQSMTFDDGSKAWVPLDNVHDAIHDGGQLTPPPVPRPPAPQMEESQLGHLYAGEDPNKFAHEDFLQRHPTLAAANKASDAAQEAMISPLAGGAKSAVRGLVDVVNLPSKAVNYVAGSHVMPSIQEAYSQDTGTPVDDLSTLQPKNLGRQRLFCHSHSDHATSVALLGRQAY